MKELNHFMSILTGEFDNQEQFDQKQKAGINYPYARHVNTICNDKISDFPEDFHGFFMVEESYYTMEGQTRATPHLFLLKLKHSYWFHITNIPYYHRKHSLD